MMLRTSFIATSAAGIILAAWPLALAQTPTTAAVKTGYAPVNGLKLYYEIHGTGEPLILLHGGVVGITMFGPNWLHSPRSGGSSPSNCRATDTRPTSSGRPANQLAILPGLTHYNTSSAPVLTTVVAPFLDAPVSVSK